MKTASFDIGTGRAEGEVVKMNDQTVILRFVRGGKAIQVKRHIEKHRVEFMGDE